MHTPPLALPLAPPVGQRLDPYPFYAQMRRAHPVAYDAQAGVWAVYRYNDVRHVLLNSETFSSDLRQVTRPRFVVGDRRPSLISSDAARHRQLRAPLSHFFTPPAVARMEPRVREWTDRLLDRVIECGRMDIVQDLAGPLPLTVIIDMLGVPPPDRERFTYWWHQWLTWRNERSPFRRNTPRKRPGPWSEELDAYLRWLATQRRVDPQDDLLSTIVALEVEGERLLEGEVLEFCALLLIAAHVTTTHLIANTVLSLLEHPEALHRLRAEPAHIPLAIEEVLRYRSPVQAASRVPIRDVELGGRTIRAGQEVLVWIGSANRDEARFPEPDRFDIARSPNPHIAFGLGHHCCFGAPLARLQARIALTALLERVHALERVGEEPLEPNRNPFLLGTIRLPVRFIPSGDKERRHSACRRGKS
jgi:cytochrome P450